MLAKTCIVKNGRGDLKGTLYILSILVHCIDICRDVQQNDALTLLGLTLDSAGSKKHLLHFHKSYPGSSPYFTGIRGSAESRI